MNLPFIHFDIKVNQREMEMVLSLSLYMCHLVIGLSAPEIKGRGSHISPGGWVEGSGICILKKQMGSMQSCNNVNKIISSQPPKRSQFQYFHSKP